MERVALIVPVLVNFEGLTRLMASVDREVVPIVIPNYENNIGVSGGWNQGLERAYKANCHKAIVSNDDIVFEPGSIQTLLDSLGPGIDLMSMVNTRDYPERGSGSVHDVDYSCFAVRPYDFLDKFGRFDEHFKPAYFEDNDMYYRIEVAGGMQRKNLNARMFHSGSVTQNWGGKPFVDSIQFEKNRAYYNTKWGGWPGNEKYTAPFNGITGKTYKDW